MNVSSPVSAAVCVRERLAPLGRPLAVGCLLTGYATIALQLVAPAALVDVLGVLPDALVLPIGYLVTFGYPAAYAVLELVAAASVVTDRIERTRRDHIRAYLAEAFGERVLHHLLYLLFPMALIWAMLSLIMGVVYAVPAWGMTALSGAGVIIGNRYAWYYDPDDRRSDAGDRPGDSTDGTSNQRT